ncbi:MAG: HEAT repeat domain-containing protein, partial [Burkholderiales bacterium]
MTSMQAAEPMPGDLVTRLADPDPEVRRIAVMELPYCDEDDILPLLLGALADADPQVRAEAAKAVEGFEEPAAVTALLGLLRDPAEETRRAAADTLSELKNNSNGELLLRAVDDSDPLVQAAVFRALRPLRVAGSLAPALAGLDHPSPQVRREAT